MRNAHSFASAPVETNKDFLSVPGVTPLTSTSEVLLGSLAAPGSLLNQVSLRYGGYGTKYCEEGTETMIIKKKACPFIKRVEGLNQFENGDLSLRPDFFEPNAFAI